MMNIASRKPYSIVVPSFSHDDGITDVCEMDFPAIGDPLIGKRYLVMLLGSSVC